MRIKSIFADKDARYERIRIFDILLLSSFGADAGCTFQTKNGGLTTINLDMTSGTATNKINLSPSDNIVCTANSDSLYYTTPLKDYIVAIQGAAARRF